MMPTELADRLREQAEDRAEREYVEPTADHMEQALDEIADLLICGETIGGWTMADVLDAWLDDTPNRDACRQLAATLNVFVENGSASAFWLNAIAWQKHLVLAHFPSEIVQERAEKIARGGE